MKKWFKIISIAFISIFLLLLIALGFTQTDMFKNWLKETVVTETNAFLNGSLAIEKIDGSLLGDLEVQGLRLLDKEGNIAISLPKLMVDYSLLPLLSGTVQIDSILVDAFYLHAVQLHDSTWNLLHIAKEDTAAPPPDTTNAPLGWAINVKNFHLKDASIEVAALDSLIPTAIRDINCRFAARYEDDLQKLDLQEFRLRTTQPDLELAGFSFLAEATPEAISLTDLRIRTKKNQIDGKLYYTTPQDTLTNAQLHIDPIDFSEVEFAMPDLRLSVRPEVDLNVEIRLDSMEFALDIFEGGQKITLNGGVSPISTFLDGSNKRPCYGLSGDFKNIDLAHWMNDPAMNHRLNGKVWLQGCGISPDDAIVAVNAALRHSTLAGYPVKSVLLDASYRNKNAASRLQATTDFGDVDVNAKVRDVAKQQAFSVNYRVDHLNLAPLAGDDSLQSDLNLVGSIQGQSFDPKTIQAQLIAALSASAAMGYQIDTVFTDAKLEGEVFRIDQFFLNTPYADAKLSGKGHLSGENDLDFELALKDLSHFQEMLVADTLYAVGGFRGKVTGKLDDLSANIDYQIQDILFNDNKVQNIAGNMDAWTNSEAFRGKLETRIADAGTVDFLLENIELRSTFDNEKIDVTVDANNGDSLAAKLVAQFIPGTSQQLYIPTLKLDFKNQHWQNDGPMKVLIEENDFQLENIALKAPGSNGHSQHFLIDGQFSLTGEENLRIDIRDIDIGMLAALGTLPPDTEIGGSFFLNAELNGTADAPLLSGKMGIKNGKVNTLAYQAFGGDFNYETEKFRWHLGFRPSDNDSLTIDGYFPVNLAFTNEGEVVYADRPLEILLKSEGLPLSLLNTMPEDIEKLEGKIVSDLRIWNTLNDIRSNGYFRLENGAVKMPAFGIDYQDMQMKIAADSARISLEDLQIRREKGLMKADGYVEFDSSLVSGNIKTTLFQMTANDFMVARNNDFEVQISGNSNVSGSLDALTFGGEIAVLRSSFYLPAFTETVPPPEDYDAYPLLVAASRGKDTLKIAIKETTAVAGDSTVNDPAMEIFNNMRGSLKLSIPKNTWIKSEEMKMELSGDLDLVKNGPDFEVFGPVSIIRGNYDLMGGRFNIIEGVLTFQGGTDYDPQVQLEADYVFRNAAREKQTLTLIVTGTAFTPVIEFFLDEGAISEGDAIAYLLFGRPLEELTSGQQSDLGSSSEGSSLTEQGVSAGLGMATSYLTQIVGKKFNLDYIEIKGEDNWQKATFVAGKYITNDLFMSYERDMDFTQSQQTAEETITLEYELMRFLYLELTQGDAKKSGAEVIFKLQRK